MTGQLDETEDTEPSTQTRPDRGSSGISAYRKLFWDIVVRSILITDVRDAETPISNVISRLQARKHIATMGIFTLIGILSAVAVSFLHIYAAPPLGIALAIASYRVKNVLVPSRTPIPAPANEDHEKFRTILSNAADAFETDTPTLISFESPFMRIFSGVSAIGDIIIVTPAFIEYCDGDCLRAVAAHEMAHLKHDHSADNVTAAFGIPFAVIIPPVMLLGGGINLIVGGLPTSGAVTTTFYIVGAYLLAGAIKSLFYLHREMSEYIADIYAIAYIADVKSYVDAIYGIHVQIESSEPYTTGDVITRRLEFIRRVSHSHPVDLWEILEDNTTRN